jgi:hypothetical protein
MQQFKRAWPITLFLNFPQNNFNVITVKLELYAVKDEENMRIYMHTF